MDKKFLLIIISVMIMGFCVSLLILAGIRAGPCPAMNYGVSSQTGMSFDPAAYLGDLLKKRGFLS